MSWAVSAFSWTSIAKTKVSRHPVSLIQCGPSSQFVFELVSRDCQPHSHFSCLSLFTSQQSRHQDKNCVTSPQGAGMKGSATSEGQKDNFFCRTKVISKCQHDRVSLSCMHPKKGDAAVTITTKKRLECTLVAIDRNRSMAS